MLQRISLHLFVAKIECPSWSALSSELERTSLEIYWTALPKYEWCLKALNCTTTSHCPSRKKERESSEFPLNLGLGYAETCKDLRIP